MQISENNPSQHPILLSMNPLEPNPHNYEPFHLSQEKQETKPILTEMSTDSSRQSFFEMALLENHEAQPLQEVEKGEHLLDQICKEKVVSSSPNKPQPISVEGEEEKRVLPTEQQLFYETDSDLSSNSSGNLTSIPSQTSANNSVDTANIGEGKTIHTKLNNILASELIKGGISSNLSDTTLGLLDLTMKKCHSEIPAQNELSVLGLDQMHAQSVRNPQSYEEEKKLLTLSKTSSETSKVKLDKLKKIIHLGTGAFAKVYLMKDANSRLFAMKKIKKAKLRKANKEKQLLVEKEVLKRLNKANKSNCIRFYGFEENEECLYLILEYVDGGDFSEYLDKRKIISKDQIRQFTAEIIDILETMHSCGVIHRDLKPENLMLTRFGHLKCIDFGGAKLIDDKIKVPETYVSIDGSDEDDISNRDVRPTFNGTLYYVSPEVIEGRECGFAIDLWALGCIIYRMATGLAPFSQDTAHYAVFERILNLDLPFPPKMDPEIKDLILKLLVKDPQNRLGAGERGSNNSFAALKSHPFFKPFEKFNFSQISLKIPPENDTLMVHIKEKKEKLEQMRNLQKQKSLAHACSIKLKDENIILTGCVLKKCGWLFYKPRQLVLDSEKIQYHDPEKNILKGEIPLSSIIQVELDPESSEKFYIHKEARRYVFKIEHEHSAELWVRTITERLPNKREFS